jgi:hypothetical protein
MAFIYLYNAIFFSTGMQSSHGFEGQVNAQLVFLFLSLECLYLTLYTLRSADYFAGVHILMKACSVFTRILSYLTMESSIRIGHCPCIHI